MRLDGVLAIGASDSVAGSGTVMVNGGSSGSNATITLGVGASLTVAQLTNQAHGVITNAGTISTSNGTLVNETDAQLNNTADGTIEDAVQSARAPSPTPVR